MRRSLRFVPVILMGSLSIVYVLARPILVTRVPYVAILEFPVGAAVLALLLWSALARRERPVPSEPWRRHEQVVRTLPDPALEADARVLERWVETGEDTPAAADVFARASTADPDAREAARANLALKLAIDSRRKREALLKNKIEGV